MSVKRRTSVQRLTGRPLTRTGERDSRQAVCSCGHDCVPVDARLCLGKSRRERLLHIFTFPVTANRLRLNQFTESFERKNDHVVQPCAAAVRFRWGHALAGVDCRPDRRQHIIRTGIPASRGLFGHTDLRATGDRSSDCSGYGKPECGRESDRMFAPGLAPNHVVPNQVVPLAVVCSARETQRGWLTRCGSPPPCPLCIDGCQIAGGGTKPFGVMAANSMASQSQSSAWSKKPEARDEQ